MRRWSTCRQRIRNVVVTVTVTYGMEAANDAQAVLENTACGKDHSQKHLSKLTAYCGVTTDITISLQMSEENSNPAL